MKKIIVLAAAAVALASCSMPVKLMNSATTKKVAMQPVAGLFADVEVSPTRISYFMMPSKSVLAGGYDNVVNTAVREALDANGTWDILVAMETQVKYNAKGEIESIMVSGYPAKYVNFRSPGDDYLKTVPAIAPEDKPASGGVMGIFKK